MISDWFGWEKDSEPTIPWSHELWPKTKSTAKSAGDRTITMVDPRLHLSVRDTTPISMTVGMLLE